MRSFVAVALAAYALASTVAAAPYPTGASQKIKNVVLLTLENRSFDHYLGYITEKNPNIEGYTAGKRYCSPSANGTDICATRNARYISMHDPCHEVECTTQQIYGVQQMAVPPPGAEAGMSGFASNAAASWKTNDSAILQEVMDSFNPETLPVSTQLALEYAVFDHWHAAVPGPTIPNRLYIMAATSHGSTNNVDAKQLTLGYKSKSIFGHLQENGVTWKNYFETIPTSILFSDVRTLKGLSNIRLLTEFYMDAKQGTLPQFSMIDPNLLASGDDGHPPHDVALTEKLIKDLYDALRGSPQWDQTLFLITFDEHGGFFDHVAPPTGVPNPDGVKASNGFNFDRLGIRVPTIAISPFIPRGTVAKEVFEHSSVSATLNSIFNLPTHLTARDASARAIDSSILSLATPRTDTPIKAVDAPPKTGKRVAEELEGEWWIVYEFAKTLLGGKIPVNI
ncbi:hypothetical protein SpCBS45565_g08172 [Spizellomyces sp. 'palustris']|nr:hypothetical protein SpCBS45565_g08172 [Spizellomyces sp. 'palustris']